MTPQEQPSPEAVAGVCRVCELPIADTRAAFTEERAGRVQYFCSSACLKEFFEDPERYLYDEDEEETE